MTKVISLPVLNHKSNSPEFNELFTQIGPVNVKTKSALVHLTLNVKCGSVESKEKVIRMNAIIKDKFISSLKTPDINKIISDRDYNRLKIQLKKIFNDTLGQELIEEVYFSEIMMY